jgi:hypothetical protein
LEVEEEEEEEEEEDGRWKRKEANEKEEEEAVTSFKAVEDVQKPVGLGTYRIPAAVVARFTQKPSFGVWCVRSRIEVQRTNVSVERYDSIHVRYIANQRNTLLVTFL